jgi:hypothetical protein
MKTPVDESNEGKISELYQTLKFEAPPSWLDERIGQEAKRALEADMHSEVTETFSCTIAELVVPKTPKRPWLAWQWPLSLAASVCFVSVLWWQLGADLLPVAEDVRERGQAQRDQIQALRHQASQSAKQNMLLNTEKTKSQQSTAALAQMSPVEGEQALKTENGFTADQETLELLKLDSPPMYVNRLAAQPAPMALSELLEVIAQTKSEQQLAKAEQDSNRTATLDNKLATLQAQLLSQLIHKVEKNPEFEVSAEILNLLNEEQRRVWQTTLKEQ